MWIDLKDNWPKKPGAYKIKIMDLNGNKVIKHGLWLGAGFGFIATDYQLKKHEYIESWKALKKE